MRKSNIKVNGKNFKPNGYQAETENIIPNSIADIEGLQNALNNKQDTLTFDTTPTTNSDNPVTSGGVKTYVDNRFNGAAKAIAYDSYATMITAFNSLPDDSYNVGQNVNIVTLNVPDLWVSSVEQTSVPYTYVDDATFTSELETNGYVQVGYYKLSALETQKVDLADYQKKLTAGTNITIDANNVISASGGLQEVTASDVDSESATSGQVLTADGNGGASWQNPSGGDKWYLHNIAPVFDTEMRVRILTKSPTTFTTSTLAQYLYSNYNAGVPFEYTFLNNNIICIGKRLESNNGLACRIRYRKITQSIVDNTISNSQSAIQYDINFAVNSDTVIEL